MFDNFILSPRLRSTPWVQQRIKLNRSNNRLAFSVWVHVRSWVSAAAPSSFKSLCVSDRMLDNTDEKELVHKKQVTSVMWAHFVLSQHNIGQTKLIAVEYKAASVGAFSAVCVASRQVSWTAGSQQTVNGTVNVQYEPWVCQRINSTARREPSRAPELCLAAAEYNDAGG